MIIFLYSLLMPQYARTSEKSAATIHKIDGTFSHFLRFAASLLRDKVSWRLTKAAPDTQIYGMIKLRTKSVLMKGKNRGHTVKYNDQIHPRRRRTDREAERKMESADEGGNHSAKRWAGILIGQTC